MDCTHGGIGSTLNREPIFLLSIGLELTNIERFEEIKVFKL